MVVTTPGTDAWNAVEAKYRAVADRIVEPLRAAHPDVDCTVEVLRGAPAKVLAERSADAGLLVMGTRGRGGFAGMLLGSQSQRVLETATSPVMLVRAAADELTRRTRDAARRDRFRGHIVGVGSTSGVRVVARPLAHDPARGRSPTSWSRPSGAPAAARALAGRRRLRHRHLRVRRGAHRTGVVTEQR